MLSWLKKNKRFLKMRAIENHLGIPHDTLQKATTGAQDLPSKWNKPLEKWYKEFIKRD